MGATQDTTLLEADAELMGLYDDYVNKKRLHLPSERRSKIVDAMENIELDFGDETVEDTGSTARASDRYLADRFAEKELRKHRALEKEFDAKIFEQMVDKDPEVKSEQPNKKVKKLKTRSDKLMKNVTAEKTEASDFNEALVEAMLSSDYKEKNDSDVSSNRQNRILLEQNSKGNSKISNLEKNDAKRIRPSEDNDKTES